MRPPVTRSAGHAGGLDTNMIKQPRFGGLAAASVILGSLAALSLSACAAGPATSSDPVSHLCKTQEVVGFSCEMRDRRVIALCASPGFEKFQGDPKDNPGYAYVRVGTPRGDSVYIYPDDPKDYKKHMYYWVSLSAEPHMFIAAEKGPFLHFSLDEKSPVDLRLENLPQSWQQASLGGPDLCVHKIRRDDLDPFMAQMMRKAAWEKANGKKATQ
jgi:hypothetical protein